MHVSSINLTSKNLFSLIGQIKEGLPISSFDKLRERLQLSEKTLSETINIPKRTLTRRKQEGRLSASESERVVRIGRLFDEAVELFDGELAHAAEWFKTPARGLAGRTPLSMAETELGAQEVHALLVRLLHGVFPG